MNIADLQKLRDVAANELTTSRANLAAIDEQIELLRAQRREVLANINKTLGALKFAEYALAPQPVEQPKPSPALDRAKEALASETVDPQLNPSS